MRELIGATTNHASHYSPFSNRLAWLLRQKKTDQLLLRPSASPVILSE